MGMSASKRAVARVALSLTIAATATALSASLASAQNGFTRIQAFGDSYVDTGNLFRIIGSPNPVQYPTGRFSGGTNFVDTTAQLLGISQLNYAIGGATAGSTNVVGPGIPGFFQEYTGFIASGQRFAPTDLVILNIGGNDARAYYRTGGSLAGVGAAATLSATQAITGVNALVGAGARTLVFGIGDVSTLPEATGNPAAAIGSAYSQSYNAQTQAALAVIARNGVRVETIDIALEAAETGHLVFGTLHTASAPETLDRISNMYPPHERPMLWLRIAGSLRGVVSQKLVKKADGSGRVVAQEIMVASPTIEKLLKDGSASDLYSAIRQDGLKPFWGMQTMNQALEGYAAEGIITEEDALAKAGNVTELKQNLRQAAQMRPERGIAEESAEEECGLTQLAAVSAALPSGPARNTFAEVGGS